MRAEHVSFGAWTERIIGGMIEVHRRLGPGLLESAYEACLRIELAASGLRFERQRELPIIYRGQRIDCAYRVDLLVERQVLVELKTVERLLPIHEAQTITYLRLGRIPLGLLVNFNVRVLKSGLRRLTLEAPISRGGTPAKVSGRGLEVGEFEQGEREDGSEESLGRDPYE